MDPETEAMDSVSELKFLYNDGFCVAPESCKIWKDRAEHASAFFAEYVSTFALFDPGRLPGSSQYFVKLQLPFSCT